MKILMITNDDILIKQLQSRTDLEEHQVIIIQDSADPLDTMATVCKLQPSVLIIDDDFMKPSSSHLLKSIQKVNKNIAFIFVTSDNSIKLGREISQFGIHYYALKPIPEDNLLKSIKAIAQKKLINHN